MALSTIFSCIFALILMSVATVIAWNVKTAQKKCNEPSLATAHKYAKYTAVSFGVIAGVYLLFIIVPILIRGPTAVVY